MDAVLIDVQAGVIGIFQLKWNDPFILAGREQKKRNLLRESVSWIDSVLQWTKAKTSEDLSRTFGVKKQILENIRDIKLFILGRNFAHFSGDEQQDDRAAWGFWSQILRFAMTCYERSSPIEWLYGKLVHESPFNRKSPSLPDEQFQIGDITITVSFGGEG